MVLLGGPEEKNNFPTRGHCAAPFKGSRLAFQNYRDTVQSLYLWKSKDTVKNCWHTKKNSETTFGRTATISGYGFCYKLNEFFRELLELIIKVQKFPDLKLNFVEELQFRLVLAQNSLNNKLYGEKKMILVGKILSFWIICLSFSGNFCFSFFCLNFFLALSFFSECTKKAWVVRFLF